LHWLETTWFVNKGILQLYKFAPWLKIIVSNYANDETWITFETLLLFCDVFSWLLAGEGRKAIVIPLILWFLKISHRLLLHYKTHLRINVSLSKYFLYPTSIYLHFFLKCWKRLGGSDKSFVRYESCAGQMMDDADCLESHQNQINVNLSFWPKNSGRCWQLVVVQRLFMLQISNWELKIVAVVGRWLLVRGGR